jgi:hypothetical protein
MLPFQHPDISHFFRADKKTNLCTMNRLFLIWVSAALVSGMSSCSQKVEETSPQVKSITEAVYASGSIAPLNEYKVFCAY